jgi:hypothetical protein
MTSINIMFAYVLPVECPLNGRDAPCCADSRLWASGWPVCVLSFPERAWMLAAEAPFMYDVLPCMQEAPFPRPLTRPIQHWMLCFLCRAGQNVSLTSFLSTPLLPRQSRPQRFLPQWRSPCKSPLSRGLSRESVDSRRLQYSTLFSPSLRLAASFEWAEEKEIGCGVATIERSHKRTTMESNLPSAICHMPASVLDLRIFGTRCLGVPWVSISI